MVVIVVILMMIVVVMTMTTLMKIMVMRTMNMNMSATTDICIGFVCSLVRMFVSFFCSFVLSFRFFVLYFSPLSVLPSSLTFLSSRTCSFLNAEVQARLGWGQPVAPSF